MPTSGRDSKRSSRSNVEPSSDHRKLERREKAKSAQPLSQPRPGDQGPNTLPKSQTRHSASADLLRSGPEDRTSSAPLATAQRKDEGEESRDVGVPETINESGTPPVSSLLYSMREEGDVDTATMDQDSWSLSGTEFRAQTSSTQPVAEINIAVVGARGVGKSTFVLRALDLPMPVSCAVAARQIPINGSTYLVRLLEVPFDNVELQDDDTIKWPDTIDDLVMPRIDGTVTMYDVNNKESLALIPEMLNAISKAALPCVLVSNKCDIDPADRQVNPVLIEEKAKSFVRDLGIMQASEASPESHKKCVSNLLRVILCGSAVSPNPPSHLGPGRASPENSQSPLSKEHAPPRRDSSLSRTGSEAGLQTPEHSPENDTHQSFLNLEESPSEGSPEEDAPSSDSEKEHDNTSEAPSDERGYSLDNLIDRLLAQPMSKADTKFVAMFLALYRKFAPPGQLLEAIVGRFDGLDRDDQAEMLTIVSKLRYLSVMEQWAGTYPGDFAHPRTRQQMRNFVSRLTPIRIFSIAAKNMGADLDVVVDDDDADWAYCDRTRDRSATFLTMSSTASTLLDDPPDRELLDDPGSTTVRDSTSSAPTTHTIDTIRSMSSSSGSSSSTVLNTAETAQQQAQRLIPIPRTTVTKVQWHALMDQPDELIARELTRIDWIMFSSIRPRDLVRHVSLTAAQKAACKSLVNVNRMIEHFNHVAFWASNYILLRDKPKHRALMLEKMMRIARKSRELNNYNALGALIAGVKRTAVHRLQATSELIPQAVGRDWLKLDILMGTQRSHFAYRLAWDNSSTERIPYLFLHLRDLFSAEEGNRTFVGRDGRINWKKFEVMGEVIVGIQKAQGQPYAPVTPNNEVKALVLEGKLVKDDDELYERSIQLEPAAGAANQGIRGLREMFRR
ncbi:hypothetical protein LTR66_008054 [Elasticomyces elasticus]|nr:hypothetical protein LTR66_008054 [Elasticomyces elasticus]KAK4988680.1 hypothetical protein LTR50_003759 [Elasticomyces elasticus]